MQNFIRPSLAQGRRDLVPSAFRITKSEGPFRLPAPFYFVSAVACVLALLTPNPVLSVACIIVLVLIVRLLWRPAEAPAMVMAMGIQWLQVAGKVIQANSEGMTVAQFALSPNLETAIWLGLLSILVLATGMRLAVGRLPTLPLQVLDQQLHRLSINKVFVLYLALAAYSLLIPSVVWQLLSLAQALLFVASLKWAAYYLLGYLTLRRRQKTGFLVAATLIEFVGGIGYFSDFKMVFFMAALIYFSLHLRLNLKTMLVVGLLAATLMFLSLVWVSIKHEYRDFLNQGTNQQVVLVSPMERLSKFSELARELTPTELATGSKTLFERVAYVDFFAAAMDYVPRARPHTNGGLLWRAIVHILVPRILYPSKPILASDSDLTMEYTGLTIAGGDTGTSISLGYVAENYVDFGRYLLLIPVFVIGTIWGWIYSYCVRHGRALGVGHVFGTIIVMGAGQFEVTEVKLLGGMMMSFLVYATTLRFVMPSLSRWLRNEGPVTGRVLSISRLAS
jgi:hypothetical protein